MAKTCTYRFKDGDGKDVVIEGLDAMKAYLANGGLAKLRAQAAFKPEEDDGPEATILTNNYEKLQGVKVEQSFTIAETGGQATLKVDAAKALRDLDSRRKELESLRACIGSAG